MPRYNYAQIEELLELAESAEECAMHELNVFGCIEFEEDRRFVEDDECEAFWVFAEDFGEYVAFDLY